MRQGKKYRKILSACVACIRRDLHFDKQPRLWRLLASELADHLAGIIEELQDGFPLGVNSEPDAEFPARIAEIQADRAIGRAAEPEPGHIVPVISKERLPGSIALVLREFFYSSRRFALLFDRVIALVGDGDSRKLLVSFLADVQGEDLVFFVLIEAEMAMIFNGPIGKLACAQISPPCSEPSSLMKRKPAASRRSGRGDSFL